jgi:Translation initiation factor eIF3 subunit 135
VLPEQAVGDKKKKKKKVKKVLQVKCDIEPNEYMLFTPKQLFAAMNQIAEARYKHRFAQSHFYELVYSSNAIDRVSLLREVALSIGLCLSFRDYLFEEQESPSFFELPIKPSDIGDFMPIIKKQDAEFTYAKVNYNLGAQYVANGKYENAIEIYSSTLQALLNVFQTHLDLWPLQPLRPRVRHHARCSLHLGVEERASHLHPKGTCC